MHKTQLALIGICGATSLGLSPLGAQAAPAAHHTAAAHAVAMPALPHRRMFCCNDMPTLIHRMRRDTVSFKTAGGGTRPPR